jgi:hypothetical protein
VSSCAEVTTLKGGYQIHRKCEIRNNAREVARLLKEVRDVTRKRSYSFMNIIEPKVYKNLLEAVKRVAGFNEETQSYKTPELARKLGLHIKTCARIVQSLALEDNNSLLLEKSEHF